MGCSILFYLLLFSSPVHHNTMVWSVWRAVALNKLWPCVLAAHARRSRRSFEQRPLQRTHHTLQRSHRDEWVSHCWWLKSCWNWSILPKQFWWLQCQPLILPMKISLLPTVAYISSHACISGIQNQTKNVSFKQANRLMLTCVLNVICMLYSNGC